MAKGKEFKIGIILKTIPSAFQASPLKAKGRDINILTKKQTMKKIKKCVIPAAGMGTRFLPATKALPKEMFPIIDKPVMQYLIEEAIAAGCEDIIVIT